MYINITFTCSILVQITVVSLNKHTSRVKACSSLDIKCLAVIFISKCVPLCSMGLSENVVTPNVMVYHHFPIESVTCRGIVVIFKQIQIHCSLVESSYFVP